MPPIDAGFLPRERLQALLDALAQGGRRVLAPVVRDGAIVFGEVTRADELPRGVDDEQAAGAYRLHRNGSARVFDWSTGPQALKPLVFAPRETLWRAERRDGGLTFAPVAAAAPATAVIGVRACDLAALALSDAHFIDGPARDPGYAARREALLLVAVNCAHPAATCFCASTGDGPHARAGFDLALTELDDGYLVAVGSEAGHTLAAALALEPAGAARGDAREEQARTAAAMQRRALPGRDLEKALFENLEHPRWDDVAARCLSCGNCTSVCPTCFCHATTDVAALGGGASEHVREWDSCFTQRHCAMHGYKVRPHIRQRYRQWLTHKLGSWHAQYGRSGCTGCGRCIAWCPTGIDITEEAAAICAGSAS